MAPPFMAPNRRPNSERARWTRSARRGTLRVAVWVAAAGLLCAAGGCLPAPAEPTPTEELSRKLDGMLAAVRAGKPITAEDIRSARQLIDRIKADIAAEKGGRVRERLERFVALERELDAAAAGGGPGGDAKAAEAAVDRARDALRNAL